MITEETQREYSKALVLISRAIEWVVIQRGPWAYFNTKTVKQIQATWLTSGCRIFQWKFEITLNVYTRYKVFLFPTYKQAQHHSQSLAFESFLPFYCQED